MSEEQQKAPEQHYRDALVDIQHVLAELDAQSKHHKAKLAEVAQLRAPFEADAKRLEKQINAAVGAKHGNSAGSRSSTVQTGEAARSSPGRNDFAKASVEKKQSTVTKAQYEDLLKQVRNAGRLAPGPKPPKGVIPNSIDRIDNNLQLIVQAREIKATLNAAGETLGKAWNQSRSTMR